MKTVDKALSVLDQFSLERTELGLSELSRMAGLDKAATRRLLVAMARHGFVEQVAETRKYRLGHGFLRLARIREATVPLEQVAGDVCDWLLEQANETVHVSVPGPSGMMTIAHRLPRRGNVINIIPSELLPFHATASGLVFLAFATEARVTRALALPRDKLTDSTVTDEAELREMIARFRANGYSHVMNTFEAGVASISMPFFGDGDDPAGAVALALAWHDLTDSRRIALLPLLKQAVARMETALTGIPRAQVPEVLPKA